MKMKGAKAVHYDSGPNMTPLVDVVMVILIFLMLAGSFAGTAKFIQSKAGIHQQGTSGAKQTEESIDIPTEVEISSTPGGFVAHAPGIRGPNDTTTDPNSTVDTQRITDYLWQKRDVFVSVNPQNVPKAKKFQVVLKPKKNVQFQDLIRVYQSVIGPAPDVGQPDRRIKNIAFAASS